MTKGVEVYLLISGRKKRLAILAQIARLIEVHFAHWQDARITPENLAREHDRLADLIRQGGGNRKEFSLRLMACLALLNNGHTRFHDPWRAQLHCLQNEA